MDEMKKDNGKGYADEYPQVTADHINKCYERGKTYLEKFSYYTQTDECFRFYNGDQWHGLKTGGDKPPVVNMIQPIVNYKRAIVNQSGFTINYSSMNYGENQTLYTDICDKLNKHALRTWERLKYDSKLWKVTTEAAIAGDAFAYFFDRDRAVVDRLLDTTDILFSDEQEEDIQQQEYIIIAQRLSVAHVKRAARKNNIADDEIAMIKSDDETQEQIGEKSKIEVEHDAEGGKCMAFLYLCKKGGTVHIARSTKNVLYQDLTEITGLSLYPLAHLRWSDEKGSARGVGEVKHLIPNQIEINKNIARNSLSLKQTSYPHIVYDNNSLDADAIKNLSAIGSSIGVNAKVQEVSALVSYMNPTAINQQAINFPMDLMNLTRDLAGASDAATGNVDPTRASGAAIIAVQDASAAPLNGQSANLRQFIEDIARIWFAMWLAYNPNGLEVVTEENISPVENIPPELQSMLSEPQQVIAKISADDLKALNIDVRIDVSPATPFSKFAQEQTLENLLTSGQITFDEYVEALDDDATAPKAKLQSILEQRKSSQQAQEAMQMEQMQQELMGMQGQLQSQADKEASMNGLINELWDSNIQMRLNNGNTTNDGRVPAGNTEPAAGGGAEPVQRV